MGIVLADLAVLVLVSLEMLWMATESESLGSMNNPISLPYSWHQIDWRSITEVLPRLTTEDHLRSRVLWELGWSRYAGNSGPFNERHECL